MCLHTQVLGYHGVLKIKIWVWFFAKDIFLQKLILIILTAASADWMKSPFLIYFSCRWHTHVYIIWHRIEGLIVKTPSTKKDILYAIFLYRKRCSVLFSHLISLFVGIHLSSMPPKNYWYQNKLQKPRVLGCSRPILWSLPSKPLRWRGQGCSAGSSRCPEGWSCGLEGQPWVERAKKVNRERMEPLLLWGARFRGGWWIHSVSAG